MTKCLDGVQLLEEDSQKVDVRSPVECVLKCQTKWKKKGFYTKDKQCFCTNGTTVKDENGLHGNLYLKRDEISKINCCF